MGVCVSVHVYHTRSHLFYCVVPAINKEFNQNTYLCQSEAQTHANHLTFEIGINTVTHMCKFIDIIIYRIIPGCIMTGKQIRLYRDGDNIDYRC